MRGYRFLLTCYKDNLELRRGGGEGASRQVSGEGGKSGACVAVNRVSPGA